MIQTKNIFLVIALLCLFCSCNSGHTEVSSSNIKHEEKQNLKFTESSCVLQMKEAGVAKQVTKYSIHELQNNDTSTLQNIYLPYPNTDGNFYLLNVKRGEQYNIPLSGKGNIFLNAATTLITNISSAHKTCVIQGKGGFTTDTDSMTVYAGEFKIELPTHSSISVKNYVDEPYITISCIKGSCSAERFDNIIMFEEGQEYKLNLNTGQIERNEPEVDPSKWISGVYEVKGAPVSDIFREFGRLWDLNVNYKGIDTTIKGYYQIRYRQSTLKQALEELTIFGGLTLKVTLNGNDLNISKGIDVKYLPREKR